MHGNVMGIPSMESTVEFYRLLLHDGPSPKPNNKRKLRQASPITLHPIANPKDAQLFKLASSPPKSNQFRLPHLETRILHRQRVVLNVSGAAEIGFEEILQYNEVETHRPANPLALCLTHKCDPNDEVPLMPCHSLLYRRHLLQVEQWPEPIRDRNKHWALDELPTIQAHQPHSMNTMTRITGTTGKWQMKKARDQDHIILRRGILIDESYVIVTARGEGINGRVFGVGLQSKRSLVLDVYDPALGIYHNIRISMDDLEDLFEDHRSYLVAGRKDELVHALISMLYFEYPTSSSPVLHINKIMKTSASELRRQAREKQRLLEEEEARLANLKFWTLPKRSRYRVYCGSHRINRFLCTVSIYHYPHQARNFFIVATHPTTSTQLFQTTNVFLTNAHRFQLPLGLFYAAKAANINSLPHTWNAKVKTQVAQAVAQQLRFVYNSNSEMALSVSGRVGYYTKAIQFEEAQTPESIARTAHKQSVQNLIKELQQEFYEDNSALENAKSANEEELNRELRLLEASRRELEERDEAVKAQLDEIESHGMNDLEGLDKDERHAQRQLVREKRAQVKKDRGETLAALKTVQTQITALLTKLQELNANTTTAIKARAIELDFQLNVLQKQAETPPPYVDMCNGEKRYSLHYTRSRRPRAFLGMTNQLVQGAATIQNAKVRYSVALLADRRVEFTFYAPITSKYITYETSLATWAIFSKQSIKSKVDLHAMQATIPHFIQHFGNEHEPSELLIELNNIDTKIESKQVEKPMDSNQLTQLYRDRRVILRKAQKLYHHLVSAFCERLEWHPECIIVNNIIFRQNPYLLVADDEIERSGLCIVKLLPDHKLSFIVDLSSGEHYEEIHPYTKELVLELASESAQEMQVHLELIVSNMQLIHQNDQTKLEFVD